MGFYSDMAAVADRLLASYGFSATVRGTDTASDPVTGIGSANGTERAVQAVQTRMDFKVFPESIVTKGDRMFIFGGRVERGEKMIDSAGDWAVREVQHIEPDNSTNIITKALVSG